MQSHITGDQVMNFLTFNTVDTFAFFLHDLISVTVFHVLVADKMAVHLSLRN